MNEQGDVKDICADIKRIDISRYNGKMNGVEGKTPFLIGVAGGTASGKVMKLIYYEMFSVLFILNF